MEVLRRSKRAPGLDTSAPMGERRPNINQKFD
jgi:hypothetical protein